MDISLIIVAICLAEAYLSHRQTGPVLSLKYLLLPRAEKANADRRSYYHLAVRQFLFIAAIFACAALVSLTGRRVFLFAMPVLSMIYVYRARSKSY